jgi:hypothetical protein
MYPKQRSLWPAHSWRADSAAAHISSYFDGILIPPMIQARSIQGDKRLLFARHLLPSAFSVELCTDRGEIHRYFHFFHLLPQIDLNHTPFQLVALQGIGNAVSAWQDDAEFD